MKTKKTIVVLAAILAVALLAAGGLGVYHLGMQHATQLSSAAAPAPKNGEPQRRVLYWHDPMVPGPRFDKPGKSPFMNMELVPVYADDAAGASDGANGGADGGGAVSINPRVQQNLGVRTAEVVRGSLDTGFEAVGNIAYDERATVLVQARSNGFVEKLHVRATLDPVRRGQPLAELYVPEWVAAQEEYLAVRAMPVAGNEGLLDGARQRMRLAGMDAAQIRAVEKSGKVQARLTISAPIAGQVSGLNVREGSTVSVGTPLFRINGTDSVWVLAELPEALAAQVRVGAEVLVSSPALPGAELRGKVDALLPEVNPTTRTLRARVELPNKEGKLVPGMFANLRFASPAHSDVLLVPSDAVIETGARRVVLLAQAEGRFAAVEVETGAEANGSIEVRKGLEAGQKVVVSGQFLIDSEASMKGAVARMEDGGAGDARAAPANGTPNNGTPNNGAQAASHRGEALVEDIDAEEALLSHGPIPSLQWGEMTMGFKAPPAGMPNNIAPGDKVRFEFRQTPDGQYQLITITPLDGGKN